MNSIGRNTAVLGVIVALAVPLHALPPFHAIVKWAQSADIGVITSDPQHLMVLRSDGTSVTTISLDSAVQEVAVSDNGQMLAYATEKNGLFISKTDGSGKIPIETGACQSLHWSQDAGTLLFTVKVPSASDPTQGQLVIYSVHSDGSKKTQVYSRAYSAL